MVVVVAAVAVAAVVDADVVVDNVDAPGFALDDADVEGDFTEVELDEFPARVVAVPSAEADDEVVTATATLEDTAAVEATASREVGVLGA